MAAERSWTTWLLRKIHVSKRKGLSEPIRFGAECLRVSTNIARWHGLPGKSLAYCDVTYYDVTMTYCDVIMALSAVLHESRNLYFPNHLIKETSYQGPDLWHPYGTDQCMKRYMKTKMHNGDTWWRQNNDTRVLMTGRTYTVITVYTRRHRFHDSVRNKKRPAGARFNTKMS